MYTMEMLSNKTALVTGGNSGIGFGIAKKFSDAGAEVIIAGRNSTKLKEAKDALGGNVDAIQCDVKDLSQIKSLFEEVDQEKGKLDVLVVNAGVATIRSIKQTDESAFDHQVDTNIKGTYFTVKYALPYLKDGGSIILISSIARFKAYKGMSVYGATKAAIRSFTRTFAQELAGRNIRVNSISPGPIDTPVYEKFGLPREHASVVKEAFVSVVPLRRIGTTEEVANGALFLASDQSSYITGTDMAIDGGASQL